MTNPSHERRIELEPLGVRPPPERYADDKRVAEADTSTSAVPARPLHVCPTCQYNLTGLTTRICPECGQPFTLFEARGAAFAVSEPMKRLNRVLAMDKAKTGAGILLMIGSFLLANIGGLRGGPVFVLTGRGLFMLAVLAGLLMFTGLARGWAEWAWGNTLLTAGLVAMSFALLMTL